MTTIELLPDEVLELIFCKLTFNERKLCRLVNKHWLYVCNGARITRKERVKLRRDKLHRFKNGKRYLNLVINNDVWTYLYKEGLPHHNFWSDHGHFVKSLVLSDFNCHIPILYDVINNCPNIVDLSLQFTRGSGDVDDGFVLTKESCAKLESLAKLTFNGISQKFNTGHIFVQLIKSVPNLKKLAFYHVAVNEGLKNLIELLIASQSSTLEKLTFLDCKFVTDDFLKNVLDQLGPQLTNLYLSKVPIKNINALKSHAGNIQNLQLENISLNKGSSLAGLVHLKNLNYVSLNNNNLSDKDVFLVGFNHLKGLDISQTKCTADGLVKHFGREVQENLVALKLGKLDCVTDEVLQYILPNLPHLRLLDLNSCTKVTSIGAQIIIANCPKLAHLSLFESSVKDLMEPTSINSLTNLVHLDLGDCNYLNTDNVLRLRFDKLKSFGYIGMYLSDVEWFYFVTENCPNLRKVFLGCGDSDDFCEDYDFINSRPDLFRIDETMDESSIFDF